MRNFQKKIYIFRNYKNSKPKDRETKETKREYAGKFLRNEM